MKKNQTANDIKRSPGLMIILPSISIQSAKKGSDIFSGLSTQKCEEDSLHLSIKAGIRENTGIFPPFITITVTFI